MTVDRDTWTCPDCRETVRGPIDDRATAQHAHGRMHAGDRRIAARRRAIEAEERAAARADRQRARLMSTAERERLRRAARGQQ